MRTRSQSVIFDELHTLLKFEEFALAKHRKQEDLSLQPTAMVATQLGTNVNMNNSRSN